MGSAPADSSSIRFSFGRARQLGEFWVACGGRQSHPREQRYGSGPVHQRSGHCRAIGARQRHLPVSVLGRLWRARHRGRKLGSSYLGKLTIVNSDAGDSNTIQDVKIDGSLLVYKDGTDGRNDLKIIDSIVSRSMGVANNTWEATVTAFFLILSDGVLLSFPCCC